MDNKHQKSNIKIKQVFSKCMLGWSIQKSNKIIFCHFANCAHHKTLHLHIHTQQMTLSNPTISQHSSSFVHVNTVLQIQHCSQSPMQPPPYQTPMLSSSNIANSHSNMPHTRTQHCPCTISKMIKESLPIGEKMV